VQHLLHKYTAQDLGCFLVMTVLDLGREGRMLDLNGPLEMFAQAVDVTNRHSCLLQVRTNNQISLIYKKSVNHFQSGSEQPSLNFDDLLYAT